MSPLSPTLKQAKRLIVFIVGATVLCIGVALVVLPGPAIVVIPVGLGILASEFVWARNLLRKIKELAPRIKKEVLGKGDDIAP